MLGLDAWLALLEQRHPCAVDLGLERCGVVYRRLGSPRPAKQVFTVAGTNGKGSTVAYLGAMSAALGQRVGTYTSPHIFRFNERISIQGKSVSDTFLTRAFEQVEKARAEVSLTYFEFTTLAAFLLLQHAELDCAVLEVGLGGRLDTVNLIDADCVIITPVGLDHQDFLGADLTAIATEKAGIIRQGTPLVCTQTNPPDPILSRAKSLNAPVFRRSMDFDLVAYIDPKPDPDASHKLPPLHFTQGDQSIDVPYPPMGGEHQLDNLAAALSAFLLLNPGGASNAEEIAAAIRTCSVPGRLQLAGTSPEILLDVGHNALAADAVAAYLLASGKTHVICVLGMLADKPAELVALSLDKVCRRWLCAGSPGRRGQSGEVLRQRLNTTLPDATVDSFVSLEEAMVEAISSAGDGDTILVFGSFSTVETVASWLQKSGQHTRHCTIIN